MIRNLIIALDQSYMHRFRFLLARTPLEFEAFVSWFSNIQAVTFIGEDILNKRNYFNQRDLGFSHELLRVEHRAPRENELPVDWFRLWVCYMSRQSHICKATSLKIKALAESSSKYAAELNLNDENAKADWMASLEVVLEATRY